MFGAIRKQLRHHDTGESNIYYLSNDDFDYTSLPRANINFIRDNINKISKEEYDRELIIFDSLSFLPTNDKKG